MTTTPTDDLPPLPEPDMWIPHSITELSASYTADQMRAYALADRQARAAQAEQHDRNMDGAREFINAILMGGKLWPNHWGQDVAAAAFFITDGGKSATLHEALQATPKAQAEPVAWADSRDLAEDTIAMVGCSHAYREEKRAKGLTLRYDTPLYTTPPAHHEALKVALDNERERCAMEVWYTMQEATQPDADDMGLEGWLREAEQRIRARAAIAQIDALEKPPEAQGSSGSLPQSGVDVGTQEAAPK